MKKLLLGLVLLSCSSVFAEKHTCSANASFFLRTTLDIGHSQQEMMEGKYTLGFDPSGKVYYGKIDNEIAAVAVVVAQDGDCKLKGLITLD